jgi:diguanylate cyclase (GGDEF)-like protein/PAS domain S-box-containing protein
MVETTNLTTDQPQSISDSRLIEKFEAHRDFAKVFLDAFALVNNQRRILKFNQAFCAMLGMRAIDVRKVALIEDLFTTEIHGSSKTAIDLILESSGSIRIDEVKAQRVHDKEPMQLIVSSYPYFDHDGSLLGACILLRDLTAESNLHGKYKERTIQSITDPLTGLFTRRYFEEWLDKEIERNRRQDTVPSVGLLMFDLDLFKRINDTYGHPAGDFVLSETARLLQDSCRKTDIIGRYGGEELLVLLVNSTQHGACLTAEKLRQAIQSHSYIFDDHTIQVTASVGVSVFRSNQESRMDVVKRADGCLYSAKTGGRNLAFANLGEGEFKVAEYLLTHANEPETIE